MKIVLAYFENKYIAYKTLKLFITRAIRARQINVRLQVIKINYGHLPPAFDLILCNLSFGAAWDLLPDISACSKSRLLIERNRTVVSVRGLAHSMYR